MWKNLFQHINIAEENIHIPDGNAENIPQFCMEYEQQIIAAGFILTNQPGKRSERPPRAIKLGIFSTANGRMKMFLV
jgi:hypothetical protein